ncbi:Inositol polyphosphate 5-phosphatase OCRL-1 [Hypsizygus marmoreus]|uniref:Inositol polyphosphate 5-phosphatase OCRL-1 n=1 Tax=Hypsizygus marmoreus TaxID=39966 RepID=A0A369J5N2_HYPMA|nr:Inositol polyphosphate 5-phosphatase OCRL-1 [Hypsizygus marmoreus]
MDESDDAVRALLRSSEELKAVLDTLLVESYDVDSTTTFKSTQLPSDGKPEAQNTRILAVISHKDNWSLLEEGSVFVCRLRPASENGGSKELEIQRVFPITEDFSIAIAQARRGIDLSITPANNQPPSFNLTINPGKEDGSEPGAGRLTLFTHNVKELRVLLKECKELQKIYDTNEMLLASRTEARFRWLLPYTSKHDLPSTFGVIPPDLRFINQPLHARLSPASAGLPGDDVADIELIRDDWIRIQAREASRKGRRRLRIRLGTFNVNGKLPSQDLASWVSGLAPAANASTTLPPVQQVSPLSLGEISRNPFDTYESSPRSTTTTLLAGDVYVPEHVDSDPYPDLLVLGFQELDLSTEALIYSTSTVREDAWCAAVFAALGEKAIHYRKLASRQLVGMLIVVIVKNSLFPCFTHVHTSTAGAGILGVMGNKGGTAIQVTFTPPVFLEGEALSPGPTTLTFVNSHLAAFDEMYDKRNSDFQDLSRRLTFELEVLDATGLAPLLTSAYESDALFWMGGKNFKYLNYRVDLSDTDVRSILASDRWEVRFDTLLRYDQLRKAIRTKKAFVGFSEHHITHLPTYRFSHGAMTDGLGFDIKRKPAWTDRVLYMTAPTVQLQQLSYTSHPHITMSDHRPVAADFLVDVDFYDRNAHDATARKLYRAVDLLEDLSDRTSLKLERTNVDMGDIHYRRATSQTIRLQNTGKVPCAYRFIPLDLEAEIHPDWLRIEPMQAMILPDEIIYITLTAYVDNESATKLNLAAKDLEVTLILHTIMGKDHFISVTAQYQYTCFANKLSRLIRLPGPICSLASPDDLRPEDHPINAPREVMRLVNWMMSDHANVDGLFISPADESIVDTIRECLDTGEDFPFPLHEVDPKVPLAFAATLLHLLDSLIEPVVPERLHSECVQMTSRDEAFELLDAFPAPSVNVWISVTAFLHFICQGSSDSEPSQKAERIASMFAPVLLRDDVDSPLPPVSPLGKRDFLLYFIS